MCWGSLVLSVVLALTIGALFGGIPASMRVLLVLNIMALCLIAVANLDTIFFEALVKIDILCHHYTWYKDAMAMAKTKANAKAFSLNLVCSLTISLINWVALIQADSPMAYGALAFLSILLFYQTLLAIGLCCNTNHVQYHYNFVIQSYVNWWTTFKAVLSQTWHGALPEISYTGFGMILIMVLLQSPGISYCDTIDGSGSLPQSGENSGSLHAPSQDFTLGPSTTTPLPKDGGAKGLLKTGQR